MEICLIGRNTADELLFREVVMGAHAFEVHALHRFVHSSNHRRHIPSHLPHRYGRFYSARDGVYATGQSQQVQIFRLLANSIGGVYPGSFVVALL
jgi:hypothetical protein